MKRAVFLLAALALAGCGEGKESAAHVAPQDAAKIEAPAGIARPVLSMIVAPERAGRAAEFPALLVSRVEAKPGFLILGRIAERPVQAGQSVKKGQLLARLEASALESAARAAEADLEKAQAQERSAAAAETRAAALRAQGVASDAQTEAARLGRESAQAAVAQAAAMRDKAREQLGYARLTAPMDGLVTDVFMEVGQTAAPGAPVAAISRPGALEAALDIPDALAAGLAEGARFEVGLAADAALKAQGVLRELAPAADAATRTRRARVAIEAPPAGFRLGAAATARLEGAAAAPEIRIPETALFEQGGAARVWVVMNEKAVSRSVRVARRQEGAAVIAEGLSPGERVIVAGVGGLSEGQAVRLMEDSR